MLAKVEPSSIAEIVASVRKPTALLKLEERK